MPYFPPSSGGGSGTVTSVGTGTGLTGGPVTSSGTIAVADAVVGQESVTAGPTGNRTALSVSKRTSFVATDGAASVSFVTLASGTFVGQRKSVVLSVLTNPSDLLRLVPASFHSELYSTYFTLTVAGTDYVELEWTGSTWNEVTQGKFVGGV